MQSEFFLLLYLECFLLAYHLVIVMISNIEKGFINLLNCCVLQLAISMASSSDEGVSTTVYLAILKGLERLLLTDVLTSQDAEIIVKLSVDR